MFSRLAALSRGVAEFAPPPRGTPGFGEALAPDGHPRLLASQSLLDGLGLRMSFKARPVAEADRPHWREGEAPRPVEFD